MTVSEMKRWSGGMILCLGFCAIAGAGPTTQPKVISEIEDAPPLTTSMTKEEKVVQKLKDDVTEAQLLEMNFRMDVGFSGGSPIEQGFSVPSFRLGASGNVSRFADYGFAVGPTREFSTALLPQLLPVEAWVQLKDSGRNAWKSTTTIAGKVGMFAPTLNPVYSPDLTFLPIPNYFESHRTVFPGRDIGAELHFWPLPGDVRLTLGAFNGSGIVALNSNNTRSFSSSVEGQMGIGPSNLNVGISGAVSRQSDRGNVNFMENWVADAYVTWALEDSNTWVAVDLMRGRLEDSIRIAEFAGGTLTAIIEIINHVQLMGRYEASNYSPSGTSRLRHTQVGPILQLSRKFKMFFYYDRLEEGSGAPENSGQVLMRLTI